MKTLLFFLTFLYLLGISCSRPAEQNNKGHETPKALQKDKSSFEIKRLSGYEVDMAEALYKELAEKTPELKRLEDAIKELRESKADSLESFDNYNSKNQSYFDAAKIHANSIKDSVLRDKMKTLIANSLANYNSSVSLHNDIKKTIELNYKSLNDLHTALVITKTLPVIAQYQKDHLPSTKTMTDYSNQQDTAIGKANTLLKN